LEQDCITTSEVIELSLTDLQTLLSHKAFFATIGIFFEEFGSNMIKLVSIPRIYEGRNISAILLGFLEDMASEQGLSLTTLADERTKKALSYLACRSAIKSGKKLSDAEITSLMSVLELTAFDYTCPHGRPVKLELTLPEINRLFKRT
jgi:DNA mismatch repair protein MutL